MKVRRHQYPDGDPQIIGTVDDHMIRLANRDAKNPKIKAIVKRLKSKSKTTEGFIHECFKLVVREIEYRTDEYQGEKVEVVVAPIHTLAGDRKFGDCDCMVTALCCLLIAGGVKCGIRIVAWKPESKKRFTHVYALAYDPGLDITIPMDPTAGNRGYGWEVGRRYRERTFTAHG
ncbi:MAG TPA: hypothetical protein DIS79_05850 [Bacteroidetes bacterium]|nr:hypothetical protein [Bacteroidota bacterium]HRK04097.1 hypothetical protein [Chlorobiota bacterium]